MGIALVIGIAVLLVLAGVMIFATARRRAASDAAGHVTGVLGGETRSADASTPPGAPETAEDAEQAESEEARERADETRQALGSGGAVPATTGGRAVAERQPIDEEELGVSRRQFFNRGLLLTMSLVLGSFGAAALSFIYAASAGGFGGKIKVGTALSDIMSQIQDKKAPFYVPEARSYINPYPKTAVPKAEKIPQYKPLIPEYQQGVVVLYQKCVHLGCKVPWCQTSQWFECPCHGSKYNRVGEKRGGPAPRGLDRFVAVISGDSITIDTSTVITGPPIGTDTTGQGAEGPPCVGG